MHNDDKKKFNGKTSIKKKKKLRESTSYRKRKKKMIKNFRFQQKHQTSDNGQCVQ